MNRTKNASRNILFGFILRVYLIVVPFLMRTAMIYFMGVEYLGLNSLFASILQVLNLAELGAGSAMVYSMYKPIVDGDKKTICALLNLYKQYYFIIGLVIAVVGLALTPFVPRIIKGDVPDGLNVYILYILNLIATVLTYWLFAYKSSLLQAHQRSDVTSKVMIVAVTIQYGLQLLVLWLFKNYYLYVIVMLITTTIGNIVTAIVASKLYPEYRAEGKLDVLKVKDINHRIRDLFTAKLGATIVNSADTVVISAFLGLTTLAMYQNYYFIMSSIMSIIATIFSSCLASVGNSMVTDGLQKNYKDFRIITLFILFITTVCTSCFATMYQPFITLWVGENQRFDDAVVWLLCIYFYLVVMQQIRGMYKDAAGVWHQDRFRPLISSLVNVVLNLLFVQIWGIYAIILSTIVSYLLVGIPWLTLNLFKFVFKMDWKKYSIDMIVYFIMTVAISSICYFVCGVTNNMSLLLQLIANMLISIFISVLLWIAIFRKSVYFSDMIKLLDKITHSKFHSILSKL